MSTEGQISSTSYMMLKFLKTLLSMAVKLASMWSFGSSLEMCFFFRRKQMDVGFILFSCQNKNLKNHFQEIAKNLNMRFWFKEQEEILLLC